MSQKSPLTILFSAGESSGDQHAANMFLELKKHQPDLKGFGMGGAKMAQAGIDIRYDSGSIGVIGVVEVIRHYSEIRRALKLMQQLVSTERPDLLVCVDYKEFNLKLARYAKQCGIKVLFYVSPQVWAWRPGRVKTYGKAIDMMAVIFPFETAYYDAENVPVRYVGHPSVDKVHPQRSQAEDRILFGWMKKNRWLVYCRAVVPTKLTACCRSCWRQLKFYSPACRIVSLYCPKQIQSVMTCLINTCVCQRLK